MKLQIHKDQMGFTIIEVVIAMAIFAIGILAVGKMMYMAVRTNSSGNEVTEATMLAQSTLENLKNTTDVSTLPKNGVQAPEPGLDQNGDAGGIYTRTLDFTDPDGTDDSRQIKITILWTRLSDTKTIEFETITRGNGI